MYGAAHRMAKYGKVRYDHEFEEECNRKQVGKFEAIMARLEPMLGMEK